jgi:hypothetical protein
MGDPAVADGQRVPPPPVDCLPGGHDRDAGDDAAADKLAHFARLLRSKHDPPLNVAAVNEDRNCLFRVVSIQVYVKALAHAEVRRRCLDYMEAMAKHYRDFVAGSAPPPPKATTTTMRDTTRGQRGARQQWGGFRQWWGTNLPVNQLGKKKTTV